MKKTLTRAIYLFSLTAIGLIGCTKSEVPVPSIPSKPTGQTMPVKLQVVISVGSLVYDSLPAEWRITSWDEDGNIHQKDTLLGPGATTVNIPKAHTKFQFTVNKWGITDQVTLNRDQLQENTTYILGGRKTAKKLRMEESFLFIMGDYQPSSKTLYAYNAAKNVSVVEYYQKKPQSSELQFTTKHLYSYSGDNVTKIDVYNNTNTQIGFTSFHYNEQGTKITNMQQKSYDVETFAAVDHSFPGGKGEITIDYLYNNGNSMEYKMTIMGGNMTEDRAISNSGGEGGTYRYDHQINPYAHMNLPNIYLSNISKNNVIWQDKNYSGSVPTGDVYKYEYTYNNEGYPIELIRHYKSARTGEHLYHTRTVYTYL